MAAVGLVWIWPGGVTCPAITDELAAMAAAAMASGCVDEAPDGGAVGGVPEVVTTTGMITATAVCVAWAIGLVGAAVAESFADASLPAGLPPGLVSPDFPCALFAPLLADASALPSVEVGAVAAWVALAGCPALVPWSFELPGVG